MYFWTPCNLGTARDRYINPYIFVNNIKRRTQNCVCPNLKIQIPNGQIFKILTVKNSNRVNTGEQSSKHVYNIPKPLGHHIWSILSLNLDKIWGGDPGPAVSKHTLVKHTFHFIKTHIRWNKQLILFKTHSIIQRHIFHFV